MAVRNYIIIPFAVLLLTGVVCALKFRLPRSRRLRGLLTAVGFIVFFALAAEVILFPGLAGIATTGEYAYAASSFQMDDTSRQEPYLEDESCRKLSVSVYYPLSSRMAEHSCPLVVFSHGGISYKKSNVSLFEELASHGYVVVSIDHTYQSLYTTIDGKKVWIDRSYMTQLQQEDSNADIASSYDCYQEWMGVRCADIGFVLDRFAAEAAKSGNGFYSLIDTGRIAAMGHSLGGAAALGAARQRGGIRAVIALESPYFCDILGYEGDRFTWNTEPYDCAVLNVYSDSGWPLIELDNKYEQNRTYLFNEGKTEYLYIEGSNHYTLTDLARSAPVLCALLGGGYSMSGKQSLTILNETCLAFFEKHL